MCVFESICVSCGFLFFSFVNSLFFLCLFWPGLICLYFTLSYVIFLNAWVFSYERKNTCGCGWVVRISEQLGEENPNQIYFMGKQNLFSRKKKNRFYIHLVCGVSLTTFAHFSEVCFIQIRIP